MNKLLIALKKKWLVGDGELLNIRNINFLKPAFIVGFFLGAFLFLSPSVHAATNISGQINSDTEWTVADSPYVVNATTINQNVTLTIDPGVVVKFNATTALKPSFLYKNE
jgi:hypothetical protein